jgi:hypothetical protein
VTVPSVVLVDRSPEPVSGARLAHVARALQTQVDRDFGAVWGVGVRVTAATCTAVPAGAWTISIVGEPVSGLGVRLDAHGRPVADVRAGEDWTLAASHELLEMIADPRGGRFMEGRRPATGARLHRVRYLVEVCDPCEVHPYVIDGVEVSDFVTPDYYRADAAHGTAVDFLRKLRRPLEVSAGCYLSWHDPDDGHWHQRRPDGTVSRSRGPLDPRRSPRDDRDRAFPDEAGRHDLPAIRRTYPSGERPRRRDRGRRAT